MGNLVPLTCMSSPLHLVSTFLSVGKGVYFDGDGIDRGVLSETLPETPFSEDKSWLCLAEVVVEVEWEVSRSRTELARSVSFIGKLLLDELIILKL